MKKIKLLLRLLSRGRFDLIIRYALHYFLKRNAIKLNLTRLFSIFLKLRTDSKQNDYLISVIITNHNLTEYLERSLSSIGSQTFQSIEIVVVESSSIDHLRKESLRIISSFQDRFPLIPVKIVENVPSGVVENRNLGASKALGNLLFFLDPDDYLADNCLQNLVTVLHVENADVVAASVYLNEENSSKQRIWLTPRYIHLRKFKHFNQLPLCSLLRSEVFRSIGGFSDLDTPVHEDWLFFAKAASKGFVFRSLRQPVVHVAVREGSLSRSNIHSAHDDQAKRIWSAVEKSHSVQIKSFLDSFRGAHTPRINNGHHSGIFLDVTRTQPDLYFSLLSATNIKGAQILCVRLTPEDPQNPENWALGSIYLDKAILRFYLRFFEANFENYLNFTSSKSHHLSHNPTLADKIRIQQLVDLSEIEEITEICFLFENSISLIPESWFLPSGIRSSKHHLKYFFFNGLQSMPQEKLQTTPCFVIQFNGKFSRVDIQGFNKYGKKLLGSSKHHIFMNNEFDEQYLLTRLESFVVPLVIMNRQRYEERILLTNLIVEDLH